MKFSLFFLIASSLCCGVIQSAPTAATADSAEAKTDVTNSLIESSSDVADAARSKKSPDGPQTVCQQVQTADGKSFLQCSQEPDVSATNSMNSYSAVPSSSAGKVLIPGMQYSSYNQAANGFGQQSGYASASDLKVKKICDFFLINFEFNFLNFQ